MFRRAHHAAALVPILGITSLSCYGDKTAPIASDAVVATIEVVPATVTLDSVGAVDTLTAVPRDAGGTMLSNVRLAWSSSDTAVTAVADGVITGMGGGVATIRASAENAISNPVVVTVEVLPPGFVCTQVIGFSQTHDWFSRGFESYVDDDVWQEVWRPGATIDRWTNPDFAGWSEPILSPCVTNSGSPDRVLLTISAGYNDDVNWWAGNVRVVISNIEDQYPSVREILLQPVIGGPDHQICSPNGERASTNHPVIDDAIAIVVGDEPGDDVKVGFSPEVRSCADYRDPMGHLFSEASAAAAITIGQYYAER